MGVSLLSRHRRGNPNGIARVARRGTGTKLVFRYDENGELAELSAGSDATAPRIYFNWVHEAHTFKSPSGLGGQQWCAGVVVQGTVYDDDSGGGTSGRSIELDAWVDDCIAAMTDARA
ncbi:MAG: hypothetical protein IPQ07_09355 [Myxococcales bacterium]|nr:hypothetical protein [Myxococcales bacterium]